MGSSWYIQINISKLKTDLINVLQRYFKFPPVFFKIKASFHRRVHKVFRLLMPVHFQLFFCFLLDFFSISSYLPYTFFHLHPPTPPQSPPCCPSPGVLSPAHFLRLIFPPALLNAFLSPASFKNQVSISPSRTCYTLLLLNLVEVLPRYMVIALTVLNCRHLSASPFPAVDWVPRGQQA